MPINLYFIDVLYSKTKTFYFKLHLNNFSRNNIKCTYGQDVLNLESYLMTLCKETGN